ncbi:uncharacterized protein LOC117104176, partial [Anneissia japonica]|uniref:uncharacterized protein LOC117104176 n=1 Tax=Anneissia japonica TaxID=1529436 RepID=UPI0014257FDA
MLKISQHQQQVLVKGTLNQASSTLWREQRKGRITSSVAGDCIGSVTNETIRGHSQIARVMGYYGNASSPALTWGKVNENIARKQYLAYHRLHNKHSGVSCQETGLWINLDCPYVAASPDGVMFCKQCGTGLIEIKNPYTHRHLPIKELACQKGSFLAIENGLTQLKRTHAYYAQIQIQLWSCEFEWCDFVVRTVSASDNLFVKRIQFDKEYIKAIRPRLVVFFKKGIVPELVSGNIEKHVRESAVKAKINKMLATLDAQTVASTHAEYPCGVCGDVC